MARCPSPGANYSTSMLRAAVCPYQHAILIIQSNDFTRCRLVGYEHMQLATAQRAQYGSSLTRIAGDSDNRWYRGEVIDRETNDSLRHWQVEPAAILVEELH